MTEVRFARSGDVYVAYRVVGDGPVDLVYVQGSLTHLEVEWELPQFRRYCERLGEFARLILFDKRGMGMSDRVPGATTLEERMDDIRAVMDAVGSGRAAIMGESEGGPLALLFAAAHPERTVALVLQGAEVRERTDETWPWGEATDEEFERAIATIPERFGLGLGMDVIAPSVAGQEWARAWRARVVTHAATPGSAEAFMRMAFDIDVRHVAPVVTVPALIVHAVGDRVCHVENARFLARTIPNAKYVELPGEDHAPWFDPEPTLAEIREFLTGRREAGSRDRVLATVLFTDIVGSTEQAAALGDRRWRDLLEQHHAAVRRELERYSGSELDTAGDGFFATFDGPARAIRCACAIVRAVRPLGLEVRAGLHTGEVEVLDGKVAGIAVNIGARVAAQAAAGEVLVSGTVKDLVAGSGLEFEDRGAAALRGIPGEWRLYAVAAPARA
ncbi:MAG TPA: adenylate/guanylate cyclase domain-containing protein [Gaiellaceae bacterium]|nr:adenylate/guanylate cyclase domain-containing protein [Gaiellaceae bacterium]